MTRVAPSPQTMERMEPNWGTDSFHDMSDGWKIHCETWHPDSAPRAVWLHGHGWNESTMTIGTRRLVHACKSRGIVFVAHDLHMHGLSLKQNGVEYPEVMRGNHQGANVIARHYVELSKALVAQYSLPLIVSSHSQSAVAHIMATAALVQVCKDAGVPLACQLYLAPTPSGLSPAWCPDCFFEQVCAKCCCACTCCAKATEEPALVNPGLMLGSPDRNATFLRISNVCVNMCLGSADYSDGKKYRGARARMAKEAANLNVPGAAGRVWAGSKDGGVSAFGRLDNFRTTFAAGESRMGVEVLEDGVHDLLSSDPKAQEWIDQMVAYVEEQLRTID